MSLRENMTELPPRRDNSALVAGGVAGLLAFLWSVSRIPRIEQLFATTLDADGAAQLLMGISVNVIVTLVVVWIGLLIFAAVRDWPKGMPLAFLIATLGVMAPFVYGTARGLIAAPDKQQYDIAVAEIRKARTSPAGTPIDMRVHATGDMGKFERLIKDYFAAQRADGAAYKAEIQALGYPDFLKPSRLGKDKGLKATIAALIKARAVVRKYSELDDNRITMLRDSLGVLDIDPIVREELLKSLKNAFEDDVEDRLELWRYQDRIIAHWGQAIEILAHPRGRWTTQKEKIVFFNGDDLASYRVEMQTIDGLQGQEDQLRQERAAKLARRQSQ